GHDEGDRDDQQEGGEDVCGPRQELPPRNRTGALDGMRAIVLHVAHVVQQVSGAGGGAVRDEHGEGVEPAPAVPQLCGEDDPGEEQQVLRPLTRPQGDERGARTTTSLRKLDDPEACGKRHTGNLLPPGQDELEAASLPGLRLEVNLPAEGEGELARDREAETGPTVVLRPERPEDPFALTRR